MTPTTTHLRGGGYVTIIRDPGDPLPAWLTPTKPAPTIRFLRAQTVPVHVFGDPPTLPDYEERT